MPTPKETQLLEKMDAFLRIVAQAANERAIAYQRDQYKKQFRKWRRIQRRSLITDKYIVGGKLAFRCWVSILLLISIMVNIEYATLRLLTHQERSDEEISKILSQHTEIKKHISNLHFLVDFAEKNNLEWSASTAGMLKDLLLEEISLKSPLAKNR